MATIFREALLTPTQPVKRPVPDVFQNLLLTTLAVAAVVTPFHQTDWPNPSRVVPKPQSDPPNLTIRLPIAPPFRQVDWPNPKPATQVPSFDPPNLALRAPVAVPFSQSDWPNPSVVKSTIRDDSRNLLTTTLAVTGTPFSQLDWVIPKLPVRSIQFDPPNLLGTTLAPVVVTTKPFAQFDWSVPKAVISVQQNDYQNLLISTLGPVGPMPFNQTNWPNPPFVRPATETLTIQVAFNLPPAPPVVDDGVPAPIGHPVYYVKGKRKKSRDLESSQDAIREIWRKVVAEVTAPVPKAGETVQPAAKVILPLIAAAPVESVSLASLSAELAEVRKKVELLEDEEELITILALGGYI